MDQRNEPNGANDEPACPEPNPPVPPRAPPEPGDGNRRREQFCELWEKHSGELFGYALNALRKESDALDVLQGCAARAWACFDQLRDVNSARAWFFRILRNLLANFVQARRRHVEIQDPLHEERAAPAEDGDAKQRLEAMNRALDRLGEERGDLLEVVRLRQEGLTPDEIAAFLSCCVRTVHNRYTDAVQLLRGYFREEGWGEELPPD